MLKKGSGKTLAFGLPILSDLLKEKEEIRRKNKELKKLGKKNRKESGLKALILTPTRELAFQIQKHLGNVLPEEKAIGIMTLVGGMSKQKQTRLLSYDPEILIATPGRLWEFIESGLYDYLETLKTIEFLVLDEADKMIELGHFEELDKILGFVYEKPQGKGEDDELIDGVLNQKPELMIGNGLVPEEMIEEIGFDTPIELPNQYYFDEKTKMIRIKDVNIDQKNEKIKEKKVKKKGTHIVERKKKIKTFLVSATLTKTFKKLSQKVQFSKTEKQKKQKPRNEDKENPKLQALLHKIKFTTSKPKIIDLSQIAFMPEKLVKLKTLTSEEDKPIHLYNFLLERPKEKTLIFVNTINVARRLSMILQKILKIELPPLTLHSHLQQRQRLKKLDDFLTGKNPLIVCTDVAARGLDIPKVQNVVHYQIPRDIDTYVHRSGRTARIGADGVMFSLVGPKENKRFEKMCEELGEEQDNWRKNIKEEVRRFVEQNVAKVAEEKERSEGKRMRSWFEKNSKETGIDMDEGVKEMIEKKVKGEKKGKGGRIAKKVERKKEEMKVRRGGVFLNPEMVREFMEKMGKIKK